jgi:parvulin-like peptidyl-prolyl isomerase
MNRFRQWMTGLMLIGPLAASSGQAAQDAQKEEVVEEILAKVNDDIITRSELMAKVEPFRAEMAKRLEPSELSSRIQELEARLLEEEIVRRLLLERARQRGLTAPQDAIDNAVQRIMEENQISDLERLDRTLQEMGSSLSKLQNMLREDLLTNQVIQFEVMGGVVVSESELQEYYQQQADEFQIPERVRLRQIFISGANEGALLTATELRDRLNQGVDFQQLASQYSDAPSRDRGGDEGLFERGELDPALEQAAFNLPVGSTSEVIQSKNGFHIVQVIERSGGGKRSFEDAKLDIQRRVQERKIDQARREYVEKLKKENYVEITGDILPAPLTKN